MMEPCVKRRLNRVRVDLGPDPDTQDSDRQHGRELAAPD